MRGLASLEHSFTGELPIDLAHKLWLRATAEGVKSLNWGYKKPSDESDG
jgi:hypothetical protein